MFFEKLVDSSSIDVNKNEIYVLGDFNINLLENNKYILNESLSCKANRSMTPLIHQYIEFFQSYSLKQILREPTRIKCNTSSLLDHILSNSFQKISSSGTLDIGISDHKLFFCPRKIVRYKSNSHQNLFARSFKNYDQINFERALKNVKFLKIQIFFRH